MKTYNEYQSSGVEWIGEIPKNWEVKRLKKLLSTLQSGNRESGGGNIDFGIFSIGGEHIGWNGELLLNNPKYISEEFFDSLSRGQIKENDVLLVKDGATIGKTTIIIKKPFDKVAVNEHVFILRPKYNPKFLYYLISGEGGLKQIRLQMRGSAQEGLNSRFIDNTFFPFPPVIEQELVSNFLDKKIKNIYKIVENKSRQIELLKEYESIIINNIHSSEYKYKKSRLKFNVETTKGFAFKSEQFSEEGVRVVKATDIKNNTLVPNTDCFIDKKIVANYKSVELSEGDLLMSTVGSWPWVKDSAVGQIAVVPKDYFGSLLNQNTVRLEPNKKILDARFLIYLLRSDKYRSYLDLGAHGTANQASLDLRHILDYAFPKVPLSEQQKIVEYLDEKTSKIRKSIEILQKEVKLLEEYKKILINEAVTGKIKVF